MLALIAEAVLCIPKRITANDAVASFGGAGKAQVSHMSGFSDASAEPQTDDVSVGGVA